MKDQERTEHPWRVTETAIPFENKALRLRADSVVLPDGSGMEYVFIERGAAVILVPVTELGEMVLLRQYRHPVGQCCLEVPAGTARDAKGMSLEEVGAKELKEEVGGEGGKFERIGCFYSNSALADEECHVFLVTGVRLAREPQREPSEQIETILLPVKEGVRLAQEGAMKTGPSALAVLLALPKLRALGFLPAE